MLEDNENGNGIGSDAHNNDSVVGGAKPLDDETIKIKLPPVNKDITPPLPPSTNPSSESSSQGVLSQMDANKESINIDPEEIWKNIKIDPKAENEFKTRLEEIQENMIEDYLGRIEDYLGIEDYRRLSPRLNRIKKLVNFTKKDVDQYNEYRFTIMNIWHICIEEKYI